MLFCHLQYSFQESFAKTDQQLRKTILPCNLRKVNHFLQISIWLLSTIIDIVMRINCIYAQNFVIF